MSDISRDGVSPHARDGVGTYLTSEEAKEFHKIFISSFLLFTAVAVVAHILVWMWKPWLGQ